MNDYFLVTQMGECHFRLYDPLGVHADLFVGTDRALLWDTSYGFGDMKSAVREITDRPLYVVNSHGHIDHACGNYQFTESIYIHPRDFAVCMDHHGTYRKKLAVAYAKNAVDLFTGETRSVLKEGFDEEEYYRKGTGNLLPVEEGHIFELGGIDLEVSEVPGHTPGSIGLLNRKERVFYAGDAMNDNFWLFLPEACPLSVYRKTLNKAWEMEFDSLFISHFPTALPKEVLLDYMDLIDNIGQALAYPFSAPLTPESKAKLYVRKGYSVEDLEKGTKGAASIVIDDGRLQEWLGGK